MGSTIAHSSYMDIFQNLAVDMDTEGRYLFLNCIANQLRYPNSHPHYFSCCLLYLFAEANTEAIQEQITRSLLCQGSFYIIGCFAICLSTCLSAGCYWRG